VTTGNKLVVGCYGPHWVQLVGKLILERGIRVQVCFQGYCAGQGRVSVGVRRRRECLVKMGKKRLSFS
jgi:hypothetical protein